MSCNAVCIENVVMKRSKKYTFIQKSKALFAKATSFFKRRPKQSGVLVAPAQNTADSSACSAVAVSHVEAGHDCIEFRIRSLPACIALRNELSPFVLRIACASEEASSLVCVDAVSKV